MEIYIAIIAIAVFSLVIYYESRKRKEEEEKIKDLNERKKSLDSKFSFLEKTKSNFISAAAHQLREPLASTKGYVSLFLEGTFGKFSDRIKDVLSKIYISNERLIALVENLLDISHLEEGRVGFNFKKKDIVKVLKGAVNNLTMQARSKNLTLKFIPPKKRIPQIWIDEEKIKEVLVNLIDNALVYTRRGGATVQIERVRNKILIIIRDTGIGLEKEELDRLFGKFCRGTESCKMNATGAGLALFVSKKIVAAHKGSIKAESKGKNKGSTFTLILPLNLKKPPGKRYVQTALKAEVN